MVMIASETFHRVSLHTTVHKEGRDSRADVQSHSHSREHTAPLEAPRSQSPSRRVTGGVEDRDGKKLEPPRSSERMSGRPRLGL
jgi:hypothetical protein